MTPTYSRFHTILGNRIRSIRESYGWSQHELSRRCGLNRSYYGAVERGEVNTSLQNITLIADVLKVEPSDLLKSKKATSATAAEQQKLLQRAIKAEHEVKKKSEEVIYWQTEAKAAKKEKDRSNADLARLKKRIERLQSF